MNFFCRIFGHTWWPEIDVPQTHWNTTKDGQILASSSKDETVRHYESCKRCSETREIPARPHDGDRPAGGEAAAATSS